MTAVRTASHEKTLRNAGIVSRMIAAFIDLGVVLVVQGALYLGVALIRLVLDVRAFTLPDYAWLWGTGTLGVLSIGYLTVSWAAFGRTIGYVVMGLGVLSRHRNRRVGLVQALARAAGCVFFPIGLLWVAVSSHRSSVQDLVCYTRVVYTHELSAETTITRISET